MRNDDVFEQRLVPMSISCDDLAKAGYRLSFESKATELGICEYTGKIDYDFQCTLKQVRYRGKHLPIKEFLARLHDIGLNTRGVVEYVFPHQHVNIEGKPVHHYRISGNERLDREWITSGFASDAAKYSASNMEDMVSVVHSLKNGNRDGY